MLIDVLVNFNQTILVGTYKLKYFISYIVNSRTRLTMNCINILHILKILNSAKGKMKTF